MASEPSHPTLHSPRTLAELTVRDAQADLLEVEPLDLGSGAPASAALALERDRPPADERRRGE